MKPLVLFLSFFICQLTYAHKFYMSITDIEYNADTKSLEVIIKFFTDDLEKALEENTKERLWLGTEKEVATINDYLKNYLSSNFLLTQNDQPQLMTFVGKESERDYTWVYLEYKGFDESSKVWLENKLLIELFEDQANRVNFKNGGYSKSVTLHKSHTGAQF